jgi:hypothetical protein
MAMTLRLTDAQTEALRRRAEAEHRSIQQVARAAIDAYVQHPVSHRRAQVPVSELMRMFAKLPPLEATAFRADTDREFDTGERFDAYGHARQTDNQR